MRFLTRRIYRAFPELDGYDDARCLRFLKAARRSRGAKVARGLGVFTGMLIVIGAVAGVALAVQRFWSERHFWEFWSVLFLVIAVAGPLLAMLFLRDRLLHRRLLCVLRTRGRCLSCGYGLVGLVVAPDNHVTCPECGLRVEVDPALGELTLDDTGRPRFEPRQGPPSFWTPKRKRILKRCLVALAIFVFGVIPAALGVYEIFLRVQARTAAAERPGAAALRALVEKHQPVPAGVDEPDGWKAIELAAKLLGEADQQAWRGQGDAIPDFSLIYSTPVRKRSPEEIAADDRNLELSLRLVDVYRKAGVYDALASAASARRAVRPIHDTVTQPLGTAPIQSLGVHRNFARVCAARMFLARQAGDLPEFEAAFDQLMGSARSLRQQPLLIDGLVAMACEMLGRQRAKAVVMEHPDEAWLVAIERVLDRQCAEIDPGYMFEGDEILALDSTGWLFSSPGRVRLGRFSAGVRLITQDTWELGEPLPPRLGTYAQNRDELKIRWKAVAQCARTERFERATKASLPGESDLALIRQLSPTLGPVVQTIDQTSLERRGLRTMLALERYRLAEGTYPERLDTLVPRFIAAVPLDPWSGKPLCYRRLAQHDESGREYLLYSVGADGQDDGGTPPKGSTPNMIEALRRDPAAPRGQDFIINTR